MITKLHTLEGHEERAWQLAWNPVKPILASCSSDKTVRMYAYPPRPTPTPRFQHLTTVSTGHAKAVRCLAWAPSGKRLATGSFDAQIAVWEQEVPEGDEEEEEGGDARVGEEEWECMSSLEGHETECKSVAFSSTGGLLASCSRDKTVWIWEAGPECEFEVLSVLMEHTQDVKYLAWHPTDEILASASYDDTIKLYADDPDDDWYPFVTLKGHTSTIWSLAWSPCGDYLASSSDDKSIRIWTRLSENVWETVCVLEGVHERAVFSVSWGRGDKRLKGGLGWVASTGSDGKVCVWEVVKPQKKEPGDDSPSLPTAKLIASVDEAHGYHDVNCVAWCPRVGYEDMLATAGDDGNVSVWRVSRDSSDAEETS